MTSGEGGAAPAVGETADCRSRRPESPCVSHCTLNDDNVCVGCRRTLDQISRWTLMSAEEQWAIVDGLRRR